MLTNHRGTTANYIAPAAIKKLHLVTFDTTDDTVKTATAKTDAPLGVSTDVDSADGQRCDVVLTGISPVIYGAAVTRGQLLTTDTEGRAIPAAAADRVFGMALVSGVLNDAGSILLDTRA